MIFLATTQEGFKKSLEMRKYIDIHIWCGSDVVLTSDELKKYGTSQFNYPLKGENQGVLIDALNTIKEHHPRKTIWVENDGISPSAVGTIC